MKNCDKSIIILSSEVDRSVDLTINWLYAFGFKNVIRITPEKKIDIKFIQLNNSQQEIYIEVENKKVHFSEIKAFWIRNGYFSHDYNFELDNNNLNKRINRFINNEWKVLTDYFLFQLSTVKHIGNYRELIPNKLIQLYFAQKVGIKIPNTEIISENGFGKCNDNYITKPIKDIFTFEKEMIGLASKTKMLTFLENQSTFFPSLIQKKIDKYFELRIYFFKNKFFPAAIFTEENAEIDYRSENNTGNLRIVPYKLPWKINHKLKKLMKLLKVESGSIDMIVSKEMKYYYLEVNPVGYFDNISSLCNYNIEKKIAQFLKN